MKMKIYAWQDKFIQNFNALFLAEYAVIYNTL